MPAQLPIPQATDSLLTNVSNILDFAWKRAQGARCYALGIEGVTIREMGRVLTAAEQVVAAAMEVFAGSADVEGDVAQEMADLEKAGMVLAKWLGDEDGVHAIEAFGPLFRRRFRGEEGKWE